MDDKKIPGPHTQLRQRAVSNMSPCLAGRNWSWSSRPRNYAPCHVDLNEDLERQDVARLEKLPFVKVCLSCRSDEYSCYEKYCFDRFAGEGDSTSKCFSNFFKLYWCDKSFRFDLRGPDTDAVCFPGRGPPKQIIAPAREGKIIVDFPRQERFATRVSCGLPLSTGDRNFIALLVFVGY